MRFLLDQNIPREIAGWLRTFKPDCMIEHTSEIGHALSEDQVIYRWAIDNKAVIITFDEDFADVRMHKLGNHHGIIRLRVWPTTVEEIKNAIARLFDNIRTDDIAGNLVIIDNQKIRIRKLKILL